VFDGRARIVRARAVSRIILAILLGGLMPIAFNVQPSKATGTYIRADGSVYPPDAPIFCIDNVTYVFTGNINDSIVIERDNIVIDEADSTLQGSIGSRIGINLTDRSNVTVKNVEVTKFFYGIYLNNAINNTLSGNTASNNNYGIAVGGSTGNTLVGNNVSDNDSDGFYLFYSYDNILYDNIIISNKQYGIALSYSGNNRIFHNNFIDNTNQTNLYEPFNNVWDDTYPSGGN
jgi:parallel beta-helix repeat protein